MTIQEEIREGIAEVVKSVTGCNDWKAREVAVKVTEKEVSQGCVIKVEGDVEKACECCAHDKWDDEDQCEVECNWYDDCWHWSPKAGYCKTVLLVEGFKGG